MGRKSGFHKVWAVNSVCGRKGEGDCNMLILEICRNLPPKWLYAFWLSLAYIVDKQEIRFWTLLYLNPEISNLVMPGLQNISGICSSLHFQSKPSGQETCCSFPLLAWIVIIRSVFLVKENNNMRIVFVNFEAIRTNLQFRCYVSIINKISIKYFFSVNSKVNQAL